MLPSPLLVLEASTGAGSVALLMHGRVVAEVDVLMGASRSDAMLPAIQAVLNDADMHAGNIRAVACGSGPGSFTSLRIAASLAKGIVVANDADLFAVPSLLLAAAGLAAKPGRYLLHSDALRGDRYVLAVVINENRAIVPGVALRMSLDALRQAAVSDSRVLVSVGSTLPRGDGDDTMLVAHARDLPALASLWTQFGPVSVAAWEPEYGRVAEAQVKWELAHGRVLPAN